MIATGTFYESVDIQQRFIRQLGEIGRDQIGELVSLFTGFYLENKDSTKYIYGIAEGRSALALYDFLQQSSRYENITPADAGRSDPPLHRPREAEPDHRRHRLGRDHERDPVPGGRVPPGRPGGALHF